MSCFSCSYFKDVDKDKTPGGKLKHESGTGKCKRYPEPQPFKHSDDWCGEYKDRYEGQPEG